MFQRRKPTGTQRFSGGSSQTTPTDQIVGSQSLSEQPIAAEYTEPAREMSMYQSIENEHLTSQPTEQMFSADSFMNNYPLENPFIQHMGSPNSSHGYESSAYQNLEYMLPRSPSSMDPGSLMYPHSTNLSTDYGLLGSQTTESETLWHEFINSQSTDSQPPEDQPLAQTHTTPHQPAASQPPNQWSGEQEHTDQTHATESVAAQATIAPAPTSSTNQGCEYFMIRHTCGHQMPLKFVQCNPHRGTEFRCDPYHMPVKEFSSNPCRSCLRSERGPRRRR